MFNFVAKRSRFVALPVKKGDCFYLERNGRSILFDGGLNHTGALSLFRSNIKKSSIDILVCSHNDADHANGLLGILESDIQVAEVWLPGRWMEGVERIANNPNQFYTDLIKDVNEQNEKDVPLESLKLRAEGTQTSEAIESIEFYLEALNERAGNGIVYQPILPWFPLSIFNHLLHDAILAADRIIKIATAAYNKGCRIRWFDFSEFSKSKVPKGGNDLLIPLNSVEVTKIKKSNLRAFELLYLSVSNKESLVFCSNVDTHPSVLFSADSDLYGVSMPIFSRPPIATAPHHGSDANKVVYPMISNALWVRSDGNYRKRPCQEYMLQKNKYCTLCRNSTGNHQTLIFTSFNHNWSTRNKKCACR